MRKAILATLFSAWTAFAVQAQDRPAEFLDKSGAGFTEWVTARLTGLPDPDGVITQAIYQILITSTGHIGQVILLYTDDEELSDRIKKQIWKSPRWKPARQNGQTVHSHIQATFRFGSVDYKAYYDDLDARAEQWKDSTGMEKTGRIEVMPKFMDDPDCLNAFRTWVAQRVQYPPLWPR